MTGTIARPSVLAAIVAFAALLVADGACRVAHADAFDWSHCDYGTSLQSFVTPVKNQEGTGECAAFASTACLESKYMLTRNNFTSFMPDLSEQNLVCAGIDSVNGGSQWACLDYFTSTGIVSEAELPWTGTDTSPNWPLQPGWQNRVWKSTSNIDSIACDTASIKAELKLYGPLVAAIDDGDLNTSTLGTQPVNHGVLIVGYADDASYPGGGYWIVKNSWGSTWNGDGYGKVMYGNVERQNDVSAITGAVYYTGAMATATWTGTTGVWAAGNSSNWTSGGSAYAWVNQETAAVFAAGVPNAVTISGTVFAHGLTFNSGATGYTFSGGSLTVTGGGIAANESVAINCPVTVGAPQTWSTASGKTLTIGGDVHTVISALTVDGAGNTYVSGAIDGGGYINSLGAPAGSFVKNGTGTLTIAGASNYGSSIALNAGTLALAPSLGSVAAYSGNIGGAGRLTVNGSGTVILSGSNTYTGATNISAGVLNVQTNQAMGTSAGGAIVSGGATLQTQGVNYRAAEALTLNGTGVSSAGALENVSASSTFAGLITLGSSGVRINSDAGTLTLSNTGTISGSGYGLTIGGAGNTTLSGGIGTGAGTLTKDGIGTLTLNKASTYTGLTTVSAGTLAYGVNDALSSGAVTVSGGTLSLGAFTDSVGAVTLSGGAISGSGAGKVTSTSGFAVSAGSASAILAGSVGLTMNGIGNTVTLSGVNTYTGLTTVSAGVLDLIGTGSGVAWTPVITPGSGANIMSGRLVFDYSGGAVDPATTIAGLLGTAIYTKVMRQRVNLVDNTSTDQVTLNLVASSPGDANGDGSVNGTDLNAVLSNYGMTSGATWAMGDFNADGAVDGTDLNIVLSNYGYGTSATAAMPEPSTLLLAAAGLLGLLGYAWRKNK